MTKTALSSLQFPKIFATYRLPITALDHFVNDRNPSGFPHTEIFYRADLFTLHTNRLLIFYK